MYGQSEMLLCHCQSWLLAELGLQLPWQQSVSTVLVGNCMSQMWDGYCYYWQCWQLMQGLMVATDLHDMVQHTRMQNKSTVLYNFKVIQRNAIRALEVLFSLILLDTYHYTLAASKHLCKYGCSHIMGVVTSVCWVWVTKTWPMEVGPIHYLVLILRPFPTYFEAHANN